MKASEFIKLLEDEIQKEGDLEVVIRVGEMNDPEFVSAIRTIPADVTQHRSFRSIWVPWLESESKKITNSKLFEIESDFFA